MLSIASQILIEEWERELMSDIGAFWKLTVSKRVLAMPNFTIFYFLCCAHRSRLLSRKNYNLVGVELSTPPLSGLT